MFSFFDKNKTKCFKKSINFKSVSCQKEMASHLSEYAYHIKPNWNEVVIMCIGTDRSTGDSLGPIIGSKLAHLNTKSNVYILGNLSNPVHASNLATNIEEVNILSNPLVIAIDASLGNSDNVGKINFGIGSLKPGAGVKKDLPEVGDIYITGVVNVGGFMEYFVLQNTRLSLVMDMADVIAKSLEEFILSISSDTAKKA
ncbi:spore protease YyaC [Proteinivorax hydrogeniformans]|uniref:Spore protease YyaC n=1 Tax=Proteinivorax hydrogeniformans TaxID=1826727 RepID=A0AAU8HTU8_9FIRM